MSQAAISAHGLLVNQKARSVFVQIRLPPHKFFPATIIDQKGNQYTYFWMHLNANPDPIHYPGSIFNIKRFSDTVDTIQLKSFDNCLQLKSNYQVWGRVSPQHISLRTGHAEIFPLPFEKWIYATEQAKLRLQRSDISGLQTGGDDYISI